jgi:hypothetical protein
VLAAVFVDEDGECVDYCSVLPVFDAKVSGAHLCVVAAELAERLRGLGAGESRLLHISGDERDFVARRLDEHYLLVVVTRPRALTHRLLGGIERAVLELRQEAGLRAPSWEPEVEVVRVETRGATGWSYAPAVLHQGGEPVGVSAVLGRWHEGAGRHGRVCFRVRTARGEELTVVHDRALDRWERLRDRV